MRKRILSETSHQPPAFGMTYHEVSAESKAAISSVSMDIYVDMLNAGHSIQDTVSAIYYSGIMHAIKLPAYVKNKGLTK